MEFFHDNQIFDAFLQITLEAQKPLRSFSFSTCPPTEWTVTCSFLDGSEDSRRITMDEISFKREWKDFLLWFANCKIATAAPIE